MISKIVLGCGGNERERRREEFVCGWKETILRHSKFFYRDDTGCNVAMCAKCVDRDTDDEQ